MRNLVAIILLTLLATPTTALENESEREKACEGTPADAIMHLPTPIDRWGGIYCTPYGHVVAGLPGWVWTQPGTYAPVFLPSQMVGDNPEEAGNRSYFTSISAERIDGDEYEEARNALLPGTSKEGTPGAYRLDLTSVSGRQLKVVFFDYGDHAWGIWCTKRCDPSSSFMLLNMAKPAHGKGAE